MAFGRKKKEEQAANLVATGAKAIGTVLSVQDTGMTMNDNPRIKMTFRIEPIDGSPPFDAEKTKVVSRVQIPRAGDRYPVWYDLEDSSLWAFGTVENDEGRAQIRQMFGAAAESITGVGNPAAAAAPAPAAPEADPLERLNKLGELRAAGVLTDAAVTHRAGPCELPRPSGGRRAGGHAELAEGPLKVLLDRAVAQPESLSHVTIGSAECHQAEHLSLP
jgi:hypothetical protein